MASEKQADVEFFCFVILSQIHTAAIDILFSNGEL